jgi:hypothetical protein
MFYTLGSKKGYADLPDGSTEKQVGGYALTLEQAVEERKKLMFNEPYRESKGLPASEYDIFQLPECTKNMVEDRCLIQRTVIGACITRVMPISHGCISCRHDHEGDPFAECEDCIEYSNWEPVV